MGDTLSKGKKKKKTAQARTVAQPIAKEKAQPKQQTTSQVDAYAHYMNERRRNYQKDANGELSQPSVDIVRRNPPGATPYPLPGIVPTKGAPGQAYATGWFPGMGVSAYDYYQQNVYNDPEGLQLQHQMEAQSPAAQQANRERILEERAAEQRRKTGIIAGQQRQRARREQVNQINTPPEQEDPRAIMYRLFLEHVANPLNNRLPSVPQLPPEQIDVQDVLQDPYFRDTWPVPGQNPNQVMMKLPQQ